MKIFTKIIKNYKREKERFGDVHFISFLSATLSRIAYQNDNNFLNSYTSIMGPVINPEILESINSVQSNQLDNLLDDEALFGLTTPNNMFKEYTYTYKQKLYIDFIKLNMPQNINIINKDLKGNVEYKIEGSRPANEVVKYISIAWSNYGEIYVVADKRMQNTIFLLFRGTYSSKTASLYSKPTSLTPLKPCPTKDGEKFLYGIYKPTLEMIHTIIESMRYLATDFLGATKFNSVKIFTTGHSLGGAMCTIFAYLWMDIQETAPYNAPYYNMLAKNIICISLGAPRVMTDSVAVKFCEFVKAKKILFLRITTRGDPVTGMPIKSFGFQHPCSQDEEMRKQMSEDCNEMLSVIDVRSGSGSGGITRVKYDKDLDCTNEKTRDYFPNPLSHTIYLYIKYTSAVDIVKFIKGAVFAQEVGRGPNGTTYCRIVIGSNVEVIPEVTPEVIPVVTPEVTTEAKPKKFGFSVPFLNNKDKPEVKVKPGFFVIFFDVNRAREMPNTVDQDFDKTLENENQGTEMVDLTKQPQPQPQSQQSGGGFFSKAKDVAKGVGNKVGNFKLFKIGGPVAQDVRMTYDAFNKLIKKAYPLYEGDLCPMIGNDFNPFNEQMAPELMCQVLQKGGRRQRRTCRYKKHSTHKHKRHNTRNTRKKHKMHKRNKRHNTRKH